MPAGEAGGPLVGASRAVVLGAGGWFGRTAADLLTGAWGEQAPERVSLFASRPRTIEAGPGIDLQIAAIQDLASLEPAPGTLLIDCAYPTQEKVDELGVDEYRRTVAELREKVNAAIERLAPVAMVSLSSGAATCGADAPERTRVYGELKRRDEEELQALCPATGTGLCIARVYAASGPHMTKPRTYALGDLIAQAQAGGPMRVKAAHPVIRSYSLAADILDVATATALGSDPAEPVLFETGGEEVEVGELARRVAIQVAGEELPVERPEMDGSPADRYVGDPSLMESLAGRYGIKPAGLDEQIRETARGA